MEIMSEKKENELIKLEVSKEEQEIIENENQNQEKADKLKKIHKTKKVFLVEVEDEDTGEWLSAWFKKPSLKQFSMFTSIAQKDKIQALQSLMKNIFIDGNEEIINDDDYFLSAMTQIEEIVNVSASRIKKY